MLSKYYHLEKINTEAKKVDMSPFISALVASLRGKYKDVRIEQTFPGGTLGIFFKLYIDGKRKFVKTHQNGHTYQENLLQEIKVMTLLYGDLIQIEKVEIKLEESLMIFMIMDYLRVGTSLISPSNIEEYTKNIQQKLSLETIKTKYHFGQILDAGKESLETLFLNGFFHKDFYLRCNESIQRIICNDKSKMNVINHGDLSNANIMYTKNDDPIIIDWEDSIYAFPEYDYLYWLTFFSQRPYYSSTLFDKSGIDKIWGIDVMVLITIIKCRMLYQNNSYKNNQISFYERINEIYTIQ